MQGLEYGGALLGGECRVEAVERLLELGTQRVVSQLAGVLLALGQVRRQARGDCRVRYQLAQVLRVQDLAQVRDWR